MNIINTRSKCQNCKDFMDKLLKEQIERLKKEKQYLQDENEQLKKCIVEMQLPRGSMKTVASKICNFDTLKEENTLYKDAFKLVISDLINFMGKEMYRSDLNKLVPLDIYYLDIAKNINKEDKNGN